MQSYGNTITFVVDTHPFIIGIPHIFEFDSQNGAEAIRGDKILTDLHDFRFMHPFENPITNAII